MLSPSHRDCYQDFLDSLRQFQDAVNSPQVEANTVQSQFRALQERFQTQIMSLTSEGVDPSFVSRWQSLQTELHRAFRLLQTDVLFLQAARNPATLQRRYATIRDHLQALIGYVQALAQAQLT